MSASPGRRTNDLCDVCQATVDWSRDHERNFLILEFQPSFEAFQDSASKCPLCGIIFHDIFEENPYRRPQGNNEMMQRRSYQLHLERQKDLSKILIHCIDTLPNVPYPLPSSRIEEAYFLAYPSETGNRAIWRSKNPTFDDRLQTVAEWISDCDSHHAICKEHIQGQPKRLLDLTLVDNRGQIKLVNTADITKPIRYATLSHCWGLPTSKPPLKTNHSTLQEHLRGISADNLTPNFRDAVIISLKLGLDYLWIDSLCIIQDNKADWESEAANMANIYLGGYINIAATASGDAHGGIIDLTSMSLQNHWTRICPFTSDTPADSVHTDNSFVLRKSSDQTACGELSCWTYRYLTRGWVLQELALSPRTVHFPKGQLLWQCRHCFTSEDGTFWSRGLISLSNGTERASNFDLTSLESSLHLWHQWIHSYSKRDLTFATDVGPAIAGLISFFKTRTGLTPLLGLWKETLACDLAWDLRYRTRSRPPPLEPRKSEFPSWSWLSVLPQPDVDFSDNSRQPKDCVSLWIEDWEVKWTGPEFVSNLVRSRLVVSSFVRTATVHVPAFDEWSPGCSYRVFVLGDPNWTGHCNLQYRFPKTTSQTVTLLQLFQRDTLIGVCDYFLILLPRLENPREFYRIGVGEIHTLWSAMDKKKRTDIHFRELDRQSIILI